MRVRDDGMLELTDRKSKTPILIHGGIISSIFMISHKNHFYGVGTCVKTFDDTEHFVVQSPAEVSALYSATKENTT